MKRIIILFLMAIPLMSVAQTNQNVGEKITVNVNDLTADQLAKARGTQQLEKISEWAGMGQEVGDGVSGALNAIKDVTLELADSDVGRLTMALVVWKVIGDDLTDIVFGIPMWILIMVLTLWSYRRTCLPRKVVVKKEDGFFSAKEYEWIKTHEDEESLNLWTAVHAGIAIVSSIAFLLIIF